MLRIHRKSRKLKIKTTYQVGWSYRLSLELVRIKRRKKMLRTRWDSINLSWKTDAALNAWKPFQNPVKVAYVKFQKEKEEQYYRQMDVNIAIAKDVIPLILWIKKDKKWRNNLSRMAHIRALKRDKDYLIQKMMIMILMIKELWGLDLDNKIRKMMNGIEQNAILMIWFTIYRIT